MPLTTAKKVERLQLIMDRLRGDANRALTAYHMMIRLNDDAQLRGLFDGSSRVHGLNVIYTALLHEAMIVLTRMYDRANNYDKSDKVSLRVVLHFLSDNSVIRALMEEARGWYPCRHLEDKNARDVAQALLRARVRLIRLTRWEPGATWLRTMRDFRDEFLAHSLMRPEERERPRFGSIRDLLQATMPIVQDLQLGVRGLHWDWQEADDDAKEVSDSFWTALAAERLPPGRARFRSNSGLRGS